MPPTIKLPSMSGTSIAALQQAILDKYGCDSVWVESVPVKGTSRGRVDWDGVVEVFDLIDHPSAPRCYAWTHEDTESDVRVVAILHHGKIDSPRNAVRAALKS